MTKYESHAIRLSLAAGLLGLVLSGLFSLLDVDLTGKLPLEYSSQAKLWLAELTFASIVGLAIFLLADSIIRYRDERHQTKEAKRALDEAKERQEEEIERKRKAADDELNQLANNHSEAKKRQEVEIERKRKAASDEIEQLAKTHASLRAISQYLQVKKRTDRLLLDIDGDATLEWEFLLDSRDLHSDLDLQIHSEHPPPKSRGLGHSPQRPPDSNVEITSMSIGGEEIESPNRFYERRELRYPMNRETTGALTTGALMEFGVIQVPMRTTIPNAKDLEELPISMSTRFTGTFHNAPRGDYFVVEIPQLTESISVTVASVDKKKKVVAAVNTSRVVARMGHSGNVDLSESERQSLKLTERGRGLTWTAEYPKVGYHYVINFRLLDA